MNFMHLAAVLCSATEKATHDCSGGLFHLVHSLLFGNPATLREGPAVLHHQVALILPLFVTNISKPGSAGKT
jgi:hypothetical protein